MTEKWVKEKIIEAHETAIEKGFYDCPKCGNPVVTCMGAGQCDHDGTECSKINQCGEYEPKCKYCNGTGKDPNKNIGELLMLIVSELGEALEAHRCGKFTKWDLYNSAISKKGVRYGAKQEFLEQRRTEIFEMIVKDTFEDEIADVFIRLFDFCGYLRIEPNGWVLENKIAKADSATGNIGATFLHICGGLFCLSNGRWRKEYTDLSVGVTIARLLVFCQHHNIPIQKHIEAKMAYNKTRPNKRDNLY